jgi:hypothetical protein
MSRARHIAACAGVVAVVATTAAAQVPGTGDDPIREVMVDPAFVDSELPVLALRGGSPADTVVLFDGFELPWLFHPSGVRSFVPPGGLGGLEVNLSGAGAELGRGGSFVSMTPRTNDDTVWAELTPLDLTLHSASPSFSGTIRAGWNRSLRGLRADDDTAYVDAIGRVVRPLSEHWKLVVSAIANFNDDITFTRGVVAAHYTTRAWR